MIVATHLAHQNAVNVFKGINGSTGGYYTNLEGRVFSRLVYPQESPGIPMPYGCIPLIEEQPQIEHDETNARVRWHLHPVFFVAETSGDLTDSKAVVLSAKMRDDVWRALLASAATWAASGVKEFKVVDFESFAGEDDEDAPYAELQFVLELYQMFAREDLGPNAT